MTKREAINEIMYNVRLHDTADFEANDKSYTITKYKAGINPVIIEGENCYMELKNLTGARKTIALLGQKIICL